MITSDIWRDIPRGASPFCLSACWASGGSPKTWPGTCRVLARAVYAYDPLLPDEVFAEHGVTRVRTKEEIFRTCDIIAPNIPLMESSYHIIDAEAIAHMKDGVIIVNTGRGALVDTEALLAGLQSGKVKAAGLDVHETEPFHDLDHPFMKMENVVLTPHIAFQTTESFEELQHKAVLYAIDGAMGKIPAGAVNGGCVRP